MSEQDQQRPLTRRELRAREMGETGALDLSEVAELAAEAPAATEAPAPAQADQDEIEISPLNDDGTPRSRREMRQLREEALAARAAATGAPEAEAPVVEPPAAEAPVVAPPATEAPAAEASSVKSHVAEAPIAEAPIAEAPIAEAPIAAAPTVDAPAGEDSTAAVADGASSRDAAESGSDADSNAEPVVVTPLTGEIDFDSLMSPPTEPFTVEELRAAEKQAAAELAEADAPAAEPAADAPEPIPAPVSASAAVPATDPAAADAAEDAEPAAKTKRRFPWKRNRGADEGTASEEAPEAADAATEAETVVADTADADPVAEVAAAAPAPEVTVETVEAVVVEEAPEIPAAEPITAEVVPEPEAAPLVPDETIAFSAVAEPEAAPAEPEADVEPKTSYSFPDIAPPEEWRSVFDDPATRNLTSPGSPEAQGDFDDLISRAVAQEGAAGSSNTSALILPTMPDDTGGLTGPLGGTGELYVTGSLKLPKSLGETGGHSALHDSIEMDPITGELTGDPQSTGEGPAPVSARRAVSARMDSSIPVVARPAKEHSKLPLVLSLTGGGLLLAVVALGIWGASNGMFG